MNLIGVIALYRFELGRWFRTLGQSILAPVISTALYFVVFGSAIGGRMSAIDGVPYAAFIVPGLLMLSVLTESLGNAAFGIFMPKWAGTIYEVLSAPIAWWEAVIGYVGAAATKSMIASLVAGGVLGGLVLHAKNVNDAGCNAVQQTCTQPAKDAAKLGGALGPATTVALIVGAAGVAGWAF